MKCIYILYIEFITSLIMSHPCASVVPWSVFFNVTIFKTVSENRDNWQEKKSRLKNILAAENHVFASTSHLVAEAWHLSAIDSFSLSSALQVTEWTLSHSGPEGRCQGNKWPPAPGGEKKRPQYFSVRCPLEHFDRLLLFVFVAAQIWDHHGLRKCLNLTALNKHGRVYDDGETCFVVMFT